MVVLQVEIMMAIIILEVVAAVTIEGVEVMTIERGIGL